MKFSTTTLAPALVRADLLIVFAYSDKTLSAAGLALDKVAKGALKHALTSGDLATKAGATLLLRQLPGVSADRVLLVNAGDAKTLTGKTFVEAVRGALKAAIATNAKTAAIAIETLTDRGAHWAAEQVAVLTTEALFRADDLKSNKPSQTTALSALQILTDKKDEKLVKAALVAGAALGSGISLTKTLGNLPGNICTPAYLADTAKTLGRQFKFKVDVLERKQIEALKMGSFLSVAKGTVEPPKFIVLHYQGGSAKQAPVVLVGKGITFDSGGISLKPGEAMDEMKYDMCGAGSVLGTFRAIAEMKLKLNVVGLIPTCENMPSGTATRPGDIVTSMSGQTIEILNTDAEGRLILCDALTYAERFKPAAVIDIATLTGACVIALGHVNTGLFASTDALADALLGAGKTMLDPAWRLPLDEDYQESLKSNFADMANIGGRPGGAITAASFLARFAKKYDWAHLDIAGTAWKSGAAKGATGRPVSLLVEYLRGLSA